MSTSPVASTLLRARRLIGSYNRHGRMRHQRTSPQAMSAESWPALVRGLGLPPHEVQPRLIGGLHRQGGLTDELAQQRLVGHQEIEDRSKLLGTRRTAAEIAFRNAGMRGEPGHSIRPAAHEAERPEGEYLRLIQRGHPAMPKRRPGLV